MIDIHLRLRNYAPANTHAKLNALVTDALAILAVQRPPPSRITMTLTDDHDIRSADVVIREPTHGDD